MVHLAAPRAPGCILGHDERRARPKSGRQEVDLGCSVCCLAGGCGLLVALAVRGGYMHVSGTEVPARLHAAVLVHGTPPWAQR